MNETALSYSSLSSFRNCRKLFDWRYNHRIVPLESDPALIFGTVIHACLEHWHRDRDLAKVLDFIDRTYAQRDQDARQRRNWHMATAIMRAYVARYPVEDFEVEALETPFEVPVLNPDTGAASRTFVLKGKIDGILRRDGANILFEHKTASIIDAGYLEKLWTDFQIILYARAIERLRGIRIDTVLYNVIAKTRLKQAEGETEAEFEVRRAELAAKNKSGKSSATRKLPETDAEFQVRLAEWYAQPDAMVRQELILSRDRFTEIEAEVWELTQSMLIARRRGFWYRNTSQCFLYNRPCPYWPICSSGDNPNVIANAYRVENRERDAAGELTDPVEPEPIF